MRTCARDVDGSLYVLLSDHHTRSPGFRLLLGLCSLFHIHRWRNEVAFLRADRNQHRNQPHVQQRRGILGYTKEEFWQLMSIN